MPAISPATKVLILSADSDTCFRTVGDAQAGGSGQGHLPCRTPIRRSICAPRSHRASFSSTRTSGTLSGWLFIKEFKTAARPAQCGRRLLWAPPAWPGPWPALLKQYGVLGYLQAAAAREATDGSGSRRRPTKLERHGSLGARLYRRQSFAGGGGASMKRSREFHEAARPPPRNACAAPSAWRALMRSRKTTSRAERVIAEVPARRRDVHPDADDAHADLLAAQRTSRTPGAWSNPCCSSPRTSPSTSAPCAELLAAPRAL